jgi:hypothetical protein
VRVAQQEHQQVFDEAWRHEFQRAFASSGAEAAEESKGFEIAGKSNGCKVGLQVMVLAPEKHLKVHAHPNIEFECALLGGLLELREGTKKELTGLKIAATHMFEEKVVQMNQCMIDELGTKVVLSCLLCGWCVMSMPIPVGC